MEALSIIKIGGHVIDNEHSLKQFLNDFVLISGPKILVHGGGKIASTLGLKMGIEPKMHEGRRITDAATRDLVVQVYAGLINKSIVAGLQSKGCNAIGLCGADANIIKATIRPIKEIDFGYVGDVKHESVNAEILSGLIRIGLVPVVAPITHDGSGQLLNTNADTIASSLAVALSAHFEVSLIFGFEKKGVLRNIEDAESVIPEINGANYEALKVEGVISGGMLPKLENAFAAIRSGVKKVIIKDAGAIAISEAGTHITR